MLIFIIFGCIVIYCSNPVCWDYMFYFEFWNKSYCSSCKHLNSPDFIISRFLLYRNPFLLQCGDIESTPGPDKTKITNFLAVIRLSITCYCTHFQDFVNLKLTIHFTAFRECMLCEASNKKFKGFIPIIYRSPNQSNYQFDKFLFSLQDLIMEIALCNPLFLGEFNTWLPTWWVDNETSFEGTPCFLHFKDYVYLQQNQHIQLNNQPHF